VQTQPTVTMTPDNKNPYESDVLVNQYMEFHYGDSYFGVGNYPERCARLCLQATEGLERQKALDLGCAVGRSTFELARAFQRVTGLDLSQKFIDCANRLKETGVLEYSLAVEGEYYLPRTADLSKLQLSSLSDKVEFYREDACFLDERHQDYDLIFAGNLLDRLYDPESFLLSMQRCLHPRGILVISTPYTLLEEFTPRNNWLGKYGENAEYTYAFQGMKKILEPNFELVGPPVDVPFVIRETKRKFQHTIAELSIWKLCD
jgi:putative 4-mercaptohistidine N1-methyltranferase